MKLPAGKKPAPSALLYLGGARFGARPGALCEAHATARPVLGRRDLVRSLSALWFVGAAAEACASGRADPVMPDDGARIGPTRPLGSHVELYSWFDLPRDDPRSRELSGIAWDESARTLWGVQDETGNIVALVPDRELKRWGFGAVITLKMNFPLDLEGIVVTRDGFIVASEKGPRVLEVDRLGKLRRDIPLPAHFAKARENKSLESLSLSPDGRYLFTTNEAALSGDGEKATAAKGTRLRILRITRATGEMTEHAYATDPMPHEGGDYGVADLAALSSDDLLVLERGWAHGSGNTARIYRVSIADPGTSCLAMAELTADAPVLSKKLFVDLSKLPAQGFPAAKQQQDSPLLDNYEGMALGPRLRDGRDTIIVISDDNARSDQFARILVLAIS